MTVTEDEKAAKAKAAALQGALTQIEREFGKGSVMRMGDEGAQVRCAAIPTGALSLDLALGIGGVPRGRIVEVFGPESSGKTTLIYHVLAEAQKLGGTCAFIDAEHAMDPLYASQIGVNIDELLVSQPDYGEQALEIADMLVRSGAVDVVAIDSVAALTPRAELEGQMGDQSVGLQARMMSQAMRKLAGNLNRTQTLCILTNQIREKIGVMFGCFHYSTRVVLADGTTEKIGKIVNQRREVEVMSMDPVTGKIAPRKVVGWYDNGDADEWLSFEVEAGGGSGRRKFSCTPNHLIFTPDGERPAGEILEGDEVLVAVKQYALSDDQMKLIMGSLLGDGSLRYASDHNVAFRVGHHRERQREYCEWKRAMLEPFANRIGRTGNGIGFDTIPMRQLSVLHDAVYAVDGRRTVSDALIAQLDERAIAAWYCDDGTFGGSYARRGNGKPSICATALSREDRERLAQRCEELGLGRPTVSERNLLWSGAGARLFHEKIAPYVHPSLDYKLHPDFRGRFAWEARENGDFKMDLTSRMSLRPVAGRVLRRYRKPVPSAGNARPSQRKRYDLQVEGNHSYLVDHVVVHNSPETQPGGRALKFYASQRLDIRRIETLKDGTEAVGNRVRVKVVKNKVAAPFRQAEFDIEFGKGISTSGCLIDLGIEHNVVTKSGSFFSYGEERLGQGRHNAKSYLDDNVAIAKEIEERIYAALGVNDSLVEEITRPEADDVVAPVPAVAPAAAATEDDEGPLDFEKEAAAITASDERAA
ncbi:MAG TPA: recombinase RecA [Solirubrobacteraceae bacterium]|nr:recombinase RecA [Solirubrobacteraceae bacterium]